jgi:hypothetical protein
MSLKTVLPVARPSARARTTASSAAARPEVAAVAAVNKLGLLELVQYGCKPK